MENAVKQLKKSPLFNLSLTSKELFHSNFLAWIIDNYKDEFKDIFSKFIVEKQEDTVIYKVTREEKNKDLTIYFKNSSGQEKRLIIENKVKSIPYLEQLERYSEKAANSDYFMLLSIVKPVFANEHKIYTKNRTWSCLNYMDLSKLISPLVNKIQEKDSYNGAILKDYVAFIEAMSKLYDSFAIDWENDYYKFSDSTDKNIELLQSIRMHDIYLKYKYYLISTKLFGDLSKKYPDYEINCEKDWMKTNENEIVINHGMARSLGLFEVKYNIGKINNLKPLILGVQVHGNQFRLFVECEEKGIAEAVALILYNSKRWFDFSLTERDIDTIYPTSLDKVFNKYGTTFYYRSIKLQDYKINDIIHVVDKYINYIIENNSIIKNELLYIYV